MRVNLITVTDDYGTNTQILVESNLVALRMCSELQRYGFTVFLGEVDDPLNVVRDDKERERARLLITLIYNSWSQAWSL